VRIGAGESGSGLAITILDFGFSILDSGRREPPVPKTI
jgi:hypothetical protein